MRIAQLLVYILFFLSYFLQVPIVHLRDMSDICNSRPSSYYSLVRDLEFPGGANPKVDRAPIIFQKYTPLGNPGSATAFDFKLISVKTI